MIPVDFMLKPFHPGAGGFFITFSHSLWPWRRLFHGGKKTAGLSGSMGEGGITGAPSHVDVVMVTLVTFG